MNETIKNSIQNNSINFLQRNFKTSSQQRCQYVSFRTLNLSISITHNENFEMIKPAIISLLKKYKNLELHLAGHLDIPKDIAYFGEQIVTHPYVDWRELPKLISEMDINLAPLVKSTFNEAKSEIKWLKKEAIQK